ncbi:MAG: DNA polymerase III subunit delta [Pseudomonadota bacterium]|nr:DNA polymerase III subunit delta [Pseudomonadota bacterium]
MKIAPKAAESFLARPDAQCRALLLYGPDAGLVRERAKLAVRALLGENPDPMALAELAEAQLLADPPLLSDELAAISLMAPKRVILIRPAGDKLTRTVEAALPSCSAEAFLIVCAEELGPRSSLRAFFEKEPQAAALACYQDEARDVQAVARKTLEEAGVRAEREVIEYLSQQLGNDRGVTLQEINKLITYAGPEKTLSLKDAQALVDYNRDTGFDELVNAVADRDVGALENTLRLLTGEGAQPVAYLRALQRYFNRLYYIRSQMAAGQSAEQVVQGLRPPVFFRQAPILTRHAGRWSTPQIVKALKLLVSAELACKTSDLPPLSASGRRLLQIARMGN